MGYAETMKAHVVRKHLLVIYGHIFAVSQAMTFPDTKNISFTCKAGEATKALS